MKLFTLAFLAGAALGSTEVCADGSSFSGSYSGVPYFTMSSGPLGVLSQTEIAYVTAECNARLDVESQKLASIVNIVSSEPCHREKDRVLGRVYFVK